MNQEQIKAQATMLAEVNAEHDAEVQAQLDKIREATPTLSTSAMLVLLNISVWEGRKSDKQAAEDLADSKNANKKAVTVYKSVMGDCPELDAIKTLRGYARNHIHYHYTQPWSDSGLRFITTTAWFDYYPVITEARDQFVELVREFLDTYQVKVAQAQVELGDMFDPSLYPPIEELERKFRFEIVPIPLPESGDFRVDITNEAMEHLTSSYENFYAQQFNASMRNVWEKLYQPLANLADKLDYSDGETKKRFKNTLVDNVLEIVDLMRLVNVTDDPTMTKIQAQLESALRGVTPEALREDSGLRKQVRNDALEALRDTRKAIDDLPTIW